MTVPMSQKIDVNGPRRDPIHATLTAASDASREAGDVQWNFEKFVLAPDGRVVSRFRPGTEPDAQEIPKQLVAERALHDGDVAPRLATWSRDDPVTLFGAWLIDSGWDGISQAFEKVASRFADCKSYDFEVLAAGASGDLAYTVGYERTSVSIDGQPQSYTLCVTNVYRREDGEWKLVHRHGDQVVDQDRLPPAARAAAIVSRPGRAAPDVDVDPVALRARRIHPTTPR